MRARGRTSDTMGRHRRCILQQQVVLLGSLLSRLRLWRSGRIMAVLVVLDDERRARLENDVFVRLLVRVPVLPDAVVFGERALAVSRGRVQVATGPRDGVGGRSGVLVGGWVLVVR